MDGIIVVDKEKNLTSRDVVNVVSRALNTKKIGHTGTLDPIATGVLVLAVGRALKIIDILISETKEYIATAKLGILTDTLDITGQTLEEKSFDLDFDMLDKTLKSFIGKYAQEVPLYSSVKVNGKRLHEYARSGIEVSLPKREVEIFEIELLELRDDTFKFRVVVSKGCYIRSLIRDIGEKLNTKATMCDLRRTRQGSFKVEDANTLESIKNDNYKIISLYDVLKDFKMVEVDDFIANKISNGRILENRYNEDKIVFINKNHEVLAIYEVYKKDKTKIKPWCVMNIRKNAYNK